MPSSPVVSDDGRGQHTREQPTELSQSVKERPVVGLHTGALDMWATHMYHKDKLGSIQGDSGRVSLLFLTSMTVHCSTTMVSLAGGEVLLSSYTNKPSSDRGTGSPEKIQHNSFPEQQALRSGRVEKLATAICRHF